jgi:hypothetical protein
MALQRWVEAEELLVQVLSLRNAALGSEHSNTLGSKQKLALVYWGQGRYLEATGLMEKVVELCMKVMGNDHRFT